MNANSDDVYAYTIIDGKTVYMHNMIAEAMLGRELLPDEVVIHENGNTLDNRRDNLKVIKANDN